jgi:hypothetical protein
VSRPVKIVAVVASFLVVIGATWWIIDWRAQRAAEIEAANTQVRSEIADQYAELASAARLGADSTGELLANLQEHLTVTERDDEIIAEEREELKTTVRESGAALQRLSTRELPEIPERADEDAITEDLEGLVEAQDRAGTLGMELTTAALRVDFWAETLATLRAQSDRYVETVEGQPDTSDPDQLQEQWEEELEVLGDYRDAAEATAEVPGLGPLAEAYLTYIDANIEFAQEAIELLEAGEIDEYNDRLREVFGDDDPFGFQQEAADATMQVLELGVLGDLAEARDAAAGFALEVERRQRGLTPSPEPTPS